MNFELPYLPNRTSKPRKNGITMMMDKGLSLNQVEDFVEACGEFTDVVKFGFGTSLITNKLEEKLKLYCEADITPYFGGTLFEMFIVRNMFDEYRKLLDKYNMELCEVSDGSMSMPHNEKLEYINKLSSQVTVLSEVGSKDASLIIPPDEWVSQMKSELEAGSWKVIAEARESGTIGIYNKDGSANIELINDIKNHINMDNVLWEAPLKNQQVWFIKNMGFDVNLGNIAYDGIISLEALRQGLRGDTFFEFLPENLK